MAKFRLFGNPTADITNRELLHREIARQVAAEGMVLLKNDGALPLKEKRIAAYGAGVRMTIKGGTGSGDVQERYSVNVESGLKNAGFEILSTRWLDRFDKQFAQEKEEWRLGIEERIKKYKIWEVQKMFDEVIHVTPLKFPIGDKIQEEDLCECGTAIYVVARQAGESADRRREAGDFLLSDVELYNIKLLSERYKNFVLVINCGSQIDLTALDGVNIGAIIFMAQGGEEGGNALADILCGRVTPSGKLTDSWAYKYEDYPASDEYGILGNVLEQQYKEGIYVGYRYFDTFGVDVRYPFGFGLSYTKFEIATKSIDAEKSVVKLKVAVKNAGTEYSGKEVVQVYLAKPQGTIKCERHMLCAFAKTKGLRPNESEELTLTFDLTDFAVYDERDAKYVLQSGKYGVFIGNSIKDITPVAVLNLDAEVVTEICKSVCKKRGEFNEITADIKDETYSADLPVIEIKAAAIATKKNEYGNLSPIITTPQTEKYLKTLSDKDLIELTVGGGYMGRSYNVTPSVAGRTSIGLLKRGIPNINLSDGPAGLRLSPKNAYTKGGSPRYIDHVPDDWQWGWIKKFEKFFLAKSNKGYKVYQYMTAFPCATLQAQTWNIELVEKIGKAIGVEMLETGVTVWLAPGMNIHRNPLCGRNFEYYSEDPLVSGMFASAVTKGVQSHKGLGVTIKHFCCNNQEDKRESMSSNVGERALREIYLKGFEIAVKTSAPKSIMTSYNKLNGVYTPNNYELCVSVLRNEWGYKGLVMTDWTATGDNKGKHELCHKCGNDLIEPGGKAVRKYLFKAYKNKQLDMNLVRVAAANVLNLIFESSVYDLRRNK